jgi:hypothetical protein
MTERRDSGRVNTRTGRQGDAAASAGGPGRKTRANDGASAAGQARRGSARLPASKPTSDRQPAKRTAKPESHAEIRGTKRDASSTGSLNRTRGVTGVGPARPARAPRGIGLRLKFMLIL